MGQTYQIGEMHDDRFGLAHEIEEANGACKDFPWTDDPSSNECAKDLPSSDVEVL
jgi:hypothetical protein